MISMEFLQITWFLLVGVLLIGYAILDGFDLGVGFWHLFTPKKAERTVALKAIGPFWDGNEVWLVTGAGAIFAAFPPVYATVFSGFYLAMMLVLLGLIFRAVAIEFRDKITDDSWIKVWDIAFSLGSILPALLFGVALGNIVHGIPMDEAGNYTGSFFDLLNPYALLVGVTGLAMFAVHGALFLTVKTDGKHLKRSRQWVQQSWNIYLVLFLMVSLWSLFSFQREASLLPWLFTLIALAAIVSIKTLSKKGQDFKAFIASSIGITAIMAAVAATLFPYLVPNLSKSVEGLTLFNSSSSQLTLTVMLIIALIGMPVVIGYTTYIYRTFAGKVSL